MYAVIIVGFISKSQTEYGFTLPFWLFTRGGKFLLSYLHVAASEVLVRGSESEQRYRTSQ